MIKINHEYRFEKITIALFYKELGCLPEINTVCLISENPTCNAKVTRDMSDLLKESLCSFSPVHYECQWHQYISQWLQIHLQAPNKTKKPLNLF